MDKNTNSVKKPVQLPEGHMCAYCCGDCLYIGDYDNDYKKYRCGQFSGKYVTGGDYACSYFKEARR